MKASPALDTENMSVSWKQGWAYPQALLLGCFECLAVTEHKFHSHTGNAGHKQLRMQVKVIEKKVLKGLLRQD